MSYYRDASRRNWITHGETAADREIEIGCLQRIADATELMAKNYVALQNDRDMYERWYEEKREQYQRAKRRIAALKGYITRIKGKR